MKKALMILFCAIAATLAAAAQDDTDDSFVTASLIVVDPGTMLYSSVGHACLRMQCPTYDMDFCFSYEGEDVQGKMAAFFAGKLKMGMGAIPSEELISNYRSQRRGVRQYRLHIPLEARKRLWEILDNKVAEGMNLPYDYLRRGCAQTSLDFIVQALDTVQLTFAPWPEKYKRTIREIFADYTRKSAPWSLLCIHTVTGTACDASLPPRRKVVIPADLAEVLKGATVGGMPVIREKATVLSENGGSQKKVWLTPMLAALFLLVLSVSNWWLKAPFVDGLLLSIQTLIGLLVLYLLLVSTLPGNGWNWLIVPFNPLPALVWRWRGKWSPWFTALLLLWIGFMLLSPHQLTDNAYVVLVSALAAMYARQGKWILKMYNT